MPPMAIIWRFTLLGAFRAVSSAGAYLASLGTTDLDILATLLAAEPGKAWSLAALAGQLQGAGQAAPPVDAVERLLGQLAAILEPAGAEPGSVLVRGIGGVALADGPVTCDAAEFRQLLDAARAGDDPDRRIDLLAMALDLYPADLPPDQPHPYVAAMRHALRARLVDSLHDEVCAGHRIDAQAVRLSCVRRLLALAPLDQEAHAALLRCLVAQERPLEAWMHVQNMATAWRDRLGAELPRSLARCVRDLGLDKPPSAIVSPIGSLPAIDGPMVGREAETQAAMDLVLAHGAGLVTLVGPEGVGKTRMAIEIAVRLRADRGLPIWFIGLEAGATRDEVRDRVRDTLAPAGQAAEAPEDAILRATTGRPALLVLDGAGPAAAGLAEWLTTSATAPAGLKVLVTSNAALGIPGERRIDLAPLHLSGEWDSLGEMAGNAATRLFVALTARRTPGFSLTAATAPDIRSACRAAGGLPLAISLAAAQYGAHGGKGPAIEEPHGNAAAVAPPDDGANTLAPAVQASLSHLDTQTRETFARLSVLRGSWTAADAQAVCGCPDVGDRISRLADLSLVRVELDGRDVCFSVPAALGSVAGGLLDADDSARLREAHWRWFLNRGQSSTRRPALARDAANLAAAIEWGQEHAPAETLDTLALLSRDWVHAGLGPRVARTIDQLCRSLTGVAPHRRAAAAMVAVGAAEKAGLFQEAISYAEWARELGRQAGIPVIEGVATANVGLMRSHLDDQVGARRDVSEALAILRRSNDKVALAQVLAGYAGVLILLADLDGADEALDEAHRLSREADNRYGIYSSLHNRGEIALRRKEYRRAQELYLEALALASRDQDLASAVNSLSAIATVAIARRQHRRALVLHHAARAIQDVHGITCDGPASDAMAEDIETATRCLGPAVALEAQAQGEGMSFDEAEAYALDSVDEPQSRHQPGDYMPLSPAQLEVLRYSAAVPNAQSKATADARASSPHTIKAHWRDIMRCLGIHSREEVIRYAWEAGWLP